MDLMCWVLCVREHHAFWAEQLNASTICGDPVSLHDLEVNGELLFVGLDDVALCEAQWLGLYDQRIVL